MIDFELVRKQPDMIRELCVKRGSDVDVDKLLALDTELRATLTKLEELRHQRKQIAGGDRERAVQIRDEIAQLGQKEAEVRSERDYLWARLPNLLAPDTPEGKTDSDNVELERCGQIPTFNFKPEAHDAIGARLDILDIKHAANVAGSGFTYWRGDGARMLWGIFSIALEMLGSKGFLPMFTPVVTKQETLFGTGYLPFFKDDIYKIENEDLCLIGTSEQTLLGYHMGETIPASSLPLLYTAFTPCFRTEAGSYGKESRGAFRLHQFHKVEQIVICRPEESEHWHEQCLLNEKQIMEALGIPYRVVRVCTGDMGAPGYKKYDVEGWFSAFGGYRETQSNTNLLDYQSRRLGMKAKDGNKTFFPYTISATMITDRAMLAIMENNQTGSGGLTVPEPLRRFVGGKSTIG
ncbi:MAG: serine--tRNA ligase [Bryobacterales bacterium]|nr:serine--tRNA ligase [Bryobacterales bacterium]MBV9400080.1 serine--tRNA ligase [Bryobacterales bacterium]